MNESSLAADDQDDGQERITVDLDATDPAKAVSRIKAPLRRAAPNAEWAEKSNEKSKDVKRRMDRMQRSFNQQRAEDQAEFQRQLADRDARLARLEARREEGTGTDEAAHQKLMDDLQTKMEEANDKGDSKEAARIAREMARAEGKYWAALTAKQAGGTGGSTRELTQAEKDAQARKASTAGGTAQGGPTKAGIAWSKANADWWLDTIDPVSKQAKALATSLYQQKVADGDDPEEAVFFDEINAEVAKRFPEIEVKGGSRRRGESIGGDEELDEADEPHAQDRRQRTEVRRLPSQNLPDRGNANARRNSQTLTKTDQDTMRKVNMDPNNNKHVLTFLQSKQETEAENA